MQFIAYAKAPTAEVLPGCTAPTTLRAQVLVRKYDSVPVLEVAAKGDNYSITFGPPEGMKHSFTAHVGDKNVADYLQAAKDSQQAVSIAIEHARKKKSGDTKEPLPMSSPIEKLRGATAPGGKGTMEASAATTSNKLSWVNGRPTQECVSDPSEWEALAGNREGNVAPDGWEAVAPEGSDWGACAYIVRATQPAPQPSVQGTTRKANSNDLKPWDAFDPATKNPSAGSYAALKVGELLAHLVQDGTSLEEAQAVASAMLAAADSAQAVFYENNPNRRRMCPTYESCLKGVKAYKQAHPDVNVENWVTDASQYAHAFVASVVGLQVEHYAALQNRPQQTPAPAATQPEPAQPAEPALNAAEINAAIQGGPDAINALGAKLKASGQLDAIIWVVNGAVHTTQQDGAQSGPVGSYLRSKLPPAQVPQQNQAPTQQPSTTPQARPVDRAAAAVLDAANAEAIRAIYAQASREGITGEKVSIATTPQGRTVVAPGTPGAEQVSLNDLINDLAKNHTNQGEK